MNLQSTAHKIAIVAINSPLNNGDAAGRSDDAARIVVAIEENISKKSIRAGDDDSCRLRAAAGRSLGPCPRFQFQQSSERCFCAAQDIDRSINRLT
ncbi:hypothetical protein [Variovorax sp. CF313]|uniref:hypothetical protein n=1 Tax=Variovorax sp. CF313 TaxID=1144315 RepID=UPI00138ACCE4|nr:hypothetical protein [Variovorax sp. CF313]